MKNKRKNHQILPKSKIAYIQSEGSQDRKQLYNDNMGYQKQWNNIFIVLMEKAKERIEAKGKGEKKRYTHLNAEFQRIARRDKKVFSVISAKKQREKIRMGKTRDLFKKTEIPREHFMQRWAQ